MSSNPTLSSENQEISTKVDLQIISFTTQLEFEQWMEQNQNEIKGIWLRFFKKNSGIISVNYNEALDIALCYGWIDGQLNKYDGNSYIQKITHRRPKSMWSKRNKSHVERLENEGRMKSSGIKEVEMAKMDGRWKKAYDSPGKMTIPDDFITEISKNKKAFAFYETLNKTNLYTIGWRLQTAKNEVVRIKRINSIIEMLEREEKFH